MMRSAVFGLVLVLAVLPPVAQEDPIARGDAAWARRAEGHENYRAAPGPIAAAVEAYDEARRTGPRKLEAYWKLLRALQFRAQFATEERERRREIFERGRQIFEEAQEILARKTGGREKLDKMPSKELREVFQGTPEVVPIYLFGAIHYGRAFSAIAALRRGVPTHMLRYAEIIIALGPEYEGGAGQRLLAGLHSHAPKIPFLTGWVDRDKAISLLRGALEIDPNHPETRMSLALTLLKHAPEEKQEALAILHELARLEPRPEALLESLSLRRYARELLERHS